jgi:hypothetical protein
VLRAVYFCHEEFKDANPDREVCFMAMMTMECLSCGSRNLLEFSPAQLSDVETAGAAWMACNSCKRETNWKFADYGRRSGADRRRNLEPPKPQVVNNLPGTMRGSDRPAPDPDEFRQPAAPMIQHERRSISDRREMLLRQNERVPVHVPISIRYDNLDARFEEITETINVSRRGVYFKSSRPYSPGATVFVTLNYSPTNPGANIEKMGSVIRIDPPATPSDFNGVAMQIS